MVTRSTTSSSRLAVAGSDKEQHIQQGNASTANWYVRAFRAVVRVIFLMLFRVRVVGKEKVPASPVIICVNHLGWADVFMVLLFFPVQPRVYVMGEQEVKYLSAFRRKIVDSLEVFVMLDRSKPLQALRAMQDVLKRGGSILIFPEGHLGTQEGKLLELQHGAAHTSIATGAPLLPVGLTGTSVLFLRRHLTMRIAEPIYPDRFEGATRDRTHAMTDELSRVMKRLLPGDVKRARVRLLRKWLTGLL